MFVRSAPAFLASRKYCIVDTGSLVLATRCTSGSETSIKGLCSRSSASVYKPVVMP